MEMSEKNECTQNQEKILTKNLVVKMKIKNEHPMKKFPGRINCKKIRNN